MSNKWSDADIRQYMLETGDTEASLAYRLGVNRSTVNRWINGVSEVPSVAVIAMKSIYLADN